MFATLWAGLSSLCQLSAQFGLRCQGPVLASTDTVVPTGHELHPDVGEWSQKPPLGKETFVSLPQSCIGAGKLDKTDSSGM